MFRACARRFSTRRPKRTLASLGAADLKGKNVLVRVDFNVPLDKSSGVVIADDTRIQKVLPTIQHLIDHEAKVVLCSHLGRPKSGQPRDAYTLSPVASRLTELLDQPVTLAADCTGAAVVDHVDVMQAGDVLLLENVRFHAGETTNDAEFARQLAKGCLAQVYVNDAFGTCHREHASVASVASHVQGPRVAGHLLSRELECLDEVMNCPAKPFAAVVGGSKVSTKLPMLTTLLDKADTIVLGGAMIFTFLKARGISVGASMVEEESLELARELEARAKEKGVQLLLPVDVVVADSFSDTANHQTVAVDAIPDDWLGLDIGPESLERIEAALAGSRTVLWNGPMGVFEWPKFARGSFGVANAMAKLTEQGCTTVVGGGDTVSAVRKANLGDKMSHISTGGGATLALLEGRALPGTAALDNA